MNFLKSQPDQALATLLHFSLLTTPTSPDGFRHFYLNCQCLAVAKIYIELHAHAINQRQHSKGGWAQEVAVLCDSDGELIPSFSSFVDQILWSLFKTFP